MSLDNSSMHGTCALDRSGYRLRTVRCRQVLFLTLLLLCGSLRQATAQDVALKTNGLYWMATTPNIGVEVAFNPKWTMELSAAYNPWTFSNGKKMRFWLVQPEVRYWLCEKFEGHFVGAHLHGAQYFGGFNEKRYDGYLVGGGVTYGYDWILSPHWNVEAAIGIGYARLWYDRTPRIPCVKCRVREHENYYGLTKAAISLVYLF